MKYKENRRIDGTLVGFWDELGKACHLHEPYDKIYDEEGNVTEVLKEGNEIIPMTEEELEFNRAWVVRLEAERIANEYKNLRAKEYPDFKDYLDAIVKNDQVQLQQYIDACLAVKAKYPKP